MSSNAQRLLDELGVLRYRLRRPASPAGSDVRGSAPVTLSTGSPVATSAPDVPTDIAQVAVVAVSGVRLRLSAPTPEQWPGLAQAMWRRVVIWLDLKASEIEWLPPGDGRGLVLPDPGQWHTAAGRRALWQALKHAAVELAVEHGGNGRGQGDGRRAD